MTARTITLPGSGTMDTNLLVNYAAGDLGSPFRIPDDARNIWSLPGSPKFPNDFYGKQHTYDDGSEPNCVAADSWFPDGLRARDVSIGHDLLALDYATMAGTTIATIQRFSLAVEPCVRITSASGATLVASTSTPVTYQDGTMGLITDCLMRELPVQDEAGFRWEPITSIDDAGEREVAHIFAGHATFAAGERPDAFIFTHNIKQ